VQFPYSIRPQQVEMIKDIEDVLSEGGHIVLEAPTGFGKTITALYPVVNYALKHNMKILYLVRTNSQEHKVIEESKKLGVFAVGLQGRGHMCPLAIEREDMSMGNAEELSLICSKLKKEVIEGNENACPYFSNYIEDGEQIKAYIKEVHTSEEIVNLALKNKVCGYEAVKDLLKDAVVITLPYIYFLLPFLRNMLLERAGVVLRDLIVIVDEAHNFPEFARELKSDELSERTIEHMERECIDYGNHTLLNTPCVDVAEYIREAMYRVGTYAGDEKEGVIPQYAFEDELAELMKISPNDVPKLGMALARYGEHIREDKLSRRKLPRSYIYHVGDFLLGWKESYSYEYVHLVKLNDNPKIEIFCLDPSSITEIVRNAHASIHMSGTLSLRDYRYLLDLPESTMLKRYNSPFPKEHLKVLYVDDVTTRYEELKENIPRLAEYIDKLASIGKSTAVFFPSYSLLREVRKLVSLRPLVEEHGMRQRDLAHRLERFRERGGVLFSVFGGKLSEGLDFPGEQLELVIIVGIPYPKPTARLKMLQKYYQYKFGTGWELTYKVPASIKMRQAIGRLIRSENDVGVAVILDKRAPTFLESIDMALSKTPCKDIKQFFNQITIRKRGGGASS